jgi:hypothetical protein
MGPDITREWLARADLVLDRKEVGDAPLGDWDGLGYEEDNTTYGRTSIRRSIAPAWSGRMTSHSIFLPAVDVAMAAL